MTAKPNRQEPTNWKNTPYGKEKKKERQNEIDALKRETKLLSAKVASNHVARGYYVQMKEVLEDLLMLELAQKAIEARMKYETRGKLIRIDDNSLAPFRNELEKVKHIKLVEGILSASGVLDIQEIMSHLYEFMYNNQEVKRKKADPLKELKQVLDMYADKLNKIEMQTRRR